MKKLYKYILLCIVSILLCACGVDDNEKNHSHKETNLLSEKESQENTEESDKSNEKVDSISNVTVAPTSKAEEITEAPVVTASPQEEQEKDVHDNTPMITVTPISKEEQMLEENVNRLTKKNWTELTYNGNVTEAIRNSNLLNYGYLTYDKEKIYYVDGNNGGIYVSDYFGKNKKCLSTESGRALQISGEWIFYISDEGGINRLHREKGITERVYELPCGEFTLTDNKIYVNAGEGVCVMDRDGKNKEILVNNSEFQQANFSVGNGFWISNLVHETDAQWFWKGYLSGFDEEHGEQFLLNQQGMYPLLAGKIISVFDVNTFTRHVWNMETKEDIDIGIYAHRIVSDGEKIYYIRKCREGYALYSWSESETKELAYIDAIGAEFLYLTNNMVYWMPKISGKGKSVVQLWYHNIETGENGQIY